MNFFALLLFLALLSFVRAQIVIQNKSSPFGSNNNRLPQQVVMLTTVKDVHDLSTPAKILKNLGVPGFSSKHGYNHVALQGWSCQGNYSLPLMIWQNPNTYLNNFISDSDKSSRNIIKNMFRAQGVKILANAFSYLENPISGNLSASQCAIKLAQFLTDFNLDGANIDFRD